MQLVTFTQNKNTRIGLRKDNDIIDLSQVAPELPSDMLSFLEGGENTMQAAQAVQDSHTHYAVSDVHLECPITVPPMILAIGLNYKAHAEGSKSKLPTEPILFNKSSGCLQGPNDKIIKPKLANKMDYECEVAMVIGREGKCIEEKEAQNYVFGYFIVNDISDLEKILSSIGKILLSDK